MKSGSIVYARYGVGTTDEQEAVPRKARKPRRCSACQSDIAPGDVFVEHIQEVYCTGGAYCLSCMRSDPQRIPGANISFGYQDLGVLVNGRVYYKGPDPAHAR